MGATVSAALSFQNATNIAVLTLPIVGLSAAIGVDYVVFGGKAVRAVGTAVGSNPISLIIPCHRVVQQSGRVENYGWGDR